MDNISRSKSEIEEIVTMVRLDLYNHGLPCGPMAIREKMYEYDVTPLPSGKTISRILGRWELTHQRTGWYSGNENWVEENGNFNCR